MGAFAPQDLEEVDGKRLCALCGERQSRRAAGPPPAGPPRSGSTRPIYQPPPPEYSGPVPQVSVLAIASLIVSVVFPVGVLGLVLGIAALIRIRNSRGLLEGRGFAVAGTAASAVSLACWSCMVISVIFGAGEARQESKEFRAAEEMARAAGAEQAFFARFGRFGSIDELVAAQCLPAAPGERQGSNGYAYELTTADNGFQITASPSSGRGAHFYLDERSGLRSEAGKPASAESPVWNSQRRPVSATASSGG